MLPDVELRRLGRSGLQVPAIGLGGNTFGGTVDGDDAVTVIRAALDQGITFIDTADVYAFGRSEELVGQAIRGRRQDVVLATKVGMAMDESPLHSGLSRRWIISSIEASLQRLGTDHVDLYQAHVPDPNTPLDEALRAFDDLVTQGKTRYVGWSNYRAWQMAQADALSRQHGWTAGVSAQNRWNILSGPDDPTLVEACGALGIGIIPYTPLASGVLTGKYAGGQRPATGTRLGDVPVVQRRYREPHFAAVERLRHWAEERGRTTTEVAIAALLSYPEVSTVIIGARSVEQVVANARLTEWHISPEERDEALALLHQP
jgi:aryl-alcohol dehydrogenase-like predicted oxidoreductase